jgi:cytidine deaminase
MAQNPVSIDWEPLLAAARAAQANSYSPFSRFAVGAGLLTKDGRLFGGCNVENSSYGLTICAERTAVCSAVAAGARDFAAIAVVADCSPPARPCALCLGTLAELADDLPILLVNPHGERHETTLKKLLPEPFRFRR